MQLQNKTALITGASKGIGKQIALTYAREGANIAFTYHSGEERAKKIVEELRSMGVRAHAYASDASSFTAAQTLVDEVVKEFGNIDILVNNAGITQDNLLLRMTEEMFDKVIETNLKSCFNTVKASTRYFLKQKSGSIINITSVVGVDGNAGQSNYAASKAGMIGFTKSVAKELGSRSIRSNAVAPGFIETDMTQAIDDKVMADWLKTISLGRAGQAEDVAQCCVFLGSDASSYITGQVIRVDGGMR